jgi:putative flippase GtrA
VSRFILTGTVATTLDFLVYRSGLWITGLVSLSKMAGILTGLAFTYFVNKRWTFKAGKTTIRSLLKFILLYIFSITINIITNRYFLYFLSKDRELFIFLAFCFAALISATVNYIGMKFFVFPDKRRAIEQGQKPKNGITP